MKGGKHLLSFISIALVAGLQPSFSGSQIFENKGFRFLVLECLRTANSQKCTRAIIELEIIQRKASAKGWYSCQSNALGLGSDLIMTQLNVNRESSTLHMLKKVEELCFGL